MAGTLVMEDRNLYRVVVNHDDHYAMWPAQKPLPVGWIYIGVEGSRSTCLQHIGRVAAEMNARSLRSA